MVPPHFLPMKKFYYTALVLWKFSLAMLLTCLLTEYAVSQNLLSSKQTSHYSYIYKLTDVEAEAIYRFGQSGLKDSFFHTLVDSFPVGTPYDSTLPIGHYIKTKAVRNKQEVEITSVQALRIYSIKNDRDLNIQILDENGKKVKGASVWVDDKKLAYNPTTESFEDKKSNKKGLVKVQFQSSTNFFLLDRQLDNSTFKRTKNKVLYGTPLKYIWIPVRFIVYIPIDGYRSIRQNYLSGSIYKIVDFSRRAYHKTACIFDAYHCDWYDDGRTRHSTTGYLVFDKPKYKPLDTLRMKSFLVNKKGKPLHEDAKFVLRENYQKEKFIAELTPIRRGAYSYSLHLHDSLQLKLDTRYTVSIQSKSGREWIDENFYFEEYELDRNSLELTISSETHVKGNKQVLSVSAKDENDLRIKDGKLQVWVFPHHPKRFLDSVVFLPDTLMYHAAELAPDRDTEIEIPDSIFPKVEMEYEIKALLLNADYESITANKSALFKAQADPVSFELGMDSLMISKTDSETQSRSVSVFGEDEFGNKTLVTADELPIKIPVNPIFAKYSTDVEGEKQEFLVDEIDSKINISTYRDPRELSISVQNPRNIPVTYFLYRRNKLIRSGLKIDSPIRLRNKGDKNYYLSLNYIWAGQTHFQNYQIPLRKDYLKITSNEPVIVYPGEEAEIEIEVKDYKNQPVADVDLTAFGLTNKFKYEAPTVPRLAKAPKGKSLINNFTVVDNSQETITRPLDYQAWKVLASLDSISYFNFIYPESALYRFEYTVADSITQFSPFVVSKGDFEPISVIYVDQVPVYFYWNSIRQPYSFPVSPGYRQLKFRLKDKVVTLDSVYFEAQKRTILSFDPATYKGKMKSEVAEISFSQMEKNHLYHYIFPYRNPFMRDFPYLVKGENATFLGLGDNPQSEKTFLAGPISGFLDFKLLNGFTTRFDHEPYFEYDFRQGLLKMREVKDNRYPTQASRTSFSQSLKDEVMTEAKILNLWQSHLEKIRIEKAQYTNPKNTTKGNGRLELDFDQKVYVDGPPINILIFNLSNIEDIRVYPGSTRVFHDLSPGEYQLVLLFRGSSYGKMDSVQVLMDGLNFLKVPQSLPIKKDEFSNQLVDLIEKTVFSPIPIDLPSDKRELPRFQRSYLDNNRYSGPGNLVSGFIRDELGEGLPGATVIVNGTTIGTSTDLDGYYELIVPFGYSELVVSFIGYETGSIQPVIGISNDYDLTESISALQEVVITGYSVSQSKVSLSNAVVVNDEDYSGAGEFSGVLQGRVAGVSVQSIGSSGLNIQIRGASTVSFQEKPLILVDGRVFLGDINDLDLTQVKKVETLTGEEATKRFGESGKNGVILVYFREDAPTITGQINSLDWKNTGGGNIRSNFSDAAFWQPDLITDANGKARFKVKFPDDITAWQTHVLAMNAEKQIGQKQGLIKSYMPLAAQLFVPRFLVRGDTARALGKALNYLGDSVEVSTGFEINGQPVSSNWNGILREIKIDTLSVVAKDSIKVQYQLKSKSGFKDGEIRDIPVFPIGMAETTGNFAMLEKDTAFTIAVDTAAMSSTLTFWSDLSDLFEDELDYIHRYRYLCNEQMASKIKALLLQRDIDLWKNREFTQEKVLKKLIADLQKNQRSDGTWGWWKDSDPSIWITQHVVEALQQASSKGFEAGFQKNSLEESLLRNWDIEKKFETRVMMIQTFLTLESKVGYTTLLEDLEKIMPDKSLEKLRLMSIKSQLSDTVDLSDLAQFQRKSILGNTYFDIDEKESNWMSGDLRMSLMAYQILQRSSTTPDSVLKSVRNYLFEQRNRGNWINTYLSSLVLQTLVPDLLKASKYTGSQKVTLMGNLDETITNFPFIKEIQGGEALKVSKTGNLPIYYSFSEKYWNTNPVAKKGAFEISSRFDGEQGHVLQAGKAIDLIVELVVKEDAPYVMINVPIPGGCSYGNKNQRSGWETHREYFLEETAIFCENLPKGNHKFRISLEPRFTGSYTLNPAKVELMYFPTINANEGMGRVSIVD